MLLSQKPPPTPCTPTLAHHVGPDSGRGDKPGCDLAPPDTGRGMESPAAGVEQPPSTGCGGTAEPTQTGPPSDANSWAGHPHLLSSCPHKGLCVPLAGPVSRLCDQGVVPAARGPARRGWGAPGVGGWAPSTELLSFITIVTVAADGDAEEGQRWGSAEVRPAPQASGPCARPVDLGSSCVTPADGRAHMGATERTATHPGQSPSSPCLVFRNSHQREPSTSLPAPNPPDRTPTLVRRPRLSPRT